MEDYKRGSHSVWDCKYHLVWTTKYRYAVLAGDVGQRCRALPREIARSQEMVIYAGSINRDHVHMLIGIPPHISVSRAVQYLKGKSSHKLLSEFAGLRKRYWGKHLRARGYWVATSGNVTDEVWKRYIESKSLRSQTMTLTWCNRPHRRSIRLPAVTRSHRLLGGGEFTRLSR